MDFQTGTVAVLLLLAGVYFDNEVRCSSIHVVIADSDSGEVDDATANEAAQQVITFPMLEIFNSGKKPTGIKVTNHGNTGLTGESVQFMSPYDERMFRYETIPDEPSSAKSQQPKSVPVSRYFSNSIDAMLEEIQGPPPYNETARMARYVVANSNWTSMSTISTRDPTVGFPFSNIVSISDGAVGQSTGIPYFYLTPLDISVIDLKVSNKASISMTLDQEGYCQQQHYDTEDPRCARAILTGKIKKIPTGSAEESTAKAALFSRHVGMSDWPKDHGFFCAKMVISNVLLLDYFGGAKTVSVDEYFSATPY